MTYMEPLTADAGLDALAMEIARLLDKVGNVPPEEREVRRLYEEYGRALERAGIQHPIYGTATPEEVALKLRRNVAKPVKKRNQ